MNSYVPRQFNLGWKLALVIKGLPSPSLLDTYTEERLPVIQEMLELTADLLQQSLDPNRKKEIHRPPALDQLGINYTSSSIVLDEFRQEGFTKAVVTSAYQSDDILRAGARAPEAPQLLNIRTQQITSLFDIFRPYLHTVLIFPSRNDANATITAALKSLSSLPNGTVQSVVISPKGRPTLSLDSGMEPDFIVEDSEGNAFAAYGASADEGRVIVVRPDGYIGAITRGVEGVERYFSRIFSRA